MKKKVLGKGLGALVPEVEPSEAPTREIDIDRILPNPDQPRFKVDEQALEELAESIRQNGVLQPVLVRPWRDGYQLVAGERRLLAAQRAGLLKVPAVVREVPDDRLLLLALVENIQREQLNPIEEAQAYQSLLEQLKATQESLCGQIGKERSTIANALRLLKLPGPVKLLGGVGRLSPGHARALLSADLAPPEITRAAQAMAEQGWSVRQAERWARSRAKKKPVRPVPRDPDVAAAAQRLEYLLGTKVEIATRPGPAGAGVIRIHFFNGEDLNRIYTALTSKPH
jgi:ParB family chromosome partitioning protein